MLVFLASGSRLFPNALKLLSLGVSESGRPFRLERTWLMKYTEKVPYMRSLQRCLEFLSQNLCFWVRCVYKGAAEALSTDLGGTQSPCSSGSLDQMAPPANGGHRWVWMAGGDEEASGRDRRSRKSWCNRYCGCYWEPGSGLTVGCGLEGPGLRGRRWSASMTVCGSRPSMGNNNEGKLKLCFYDLRVPYWRNTCWTFGSFVPLTQVTQATLPRAKKRSFS